MTAPVGTDLQHAARMLADGKLVAFGTETVYGLGAHAFDGNAVAAVFEAKRRPHFDPLIVHLPAFEQIDRVAATISKAAVVLAERFWPGPLTMVLPKRPEVPDLVTSGRPTVAVRVPGLAVTRDLLAAAGVPVAAPSANLFGRVSPTTAVHVAEQLADVVDYIFDTGSCTVGLESTVVDLTEAQPTLLRPGGITLEQLREVLGDVAVFVKPVSGAQPAPGMLSRHYAPATPLVIVARPVPGGPNDGLLTMGEESFSGFRAVENLSPRSDLREAAVHFFSALRRLDAGGFDRLQATLFPEQGLGRALNDRLRRAAARS